MLRFFTRLERTRNFVLLVFSILMVGSLVFFYTPARNSVDTSNLGRSQTTAASVAGEKITVADIVREKENYSMFSQGRSFPSKMVLDNLINRRIIRVEAARLGLTASDAEVAAEIRKRNVDPEGKPFDQAIYEQNVVERWGSIPAYEQSVRDDLSLDKLNAYLTGGVTVSEADVLADFQKKNTKFDLSYVSVNPTELSKTLNPTDQEIQDFFNKNKASYYIAEPQKKIKYIFISTAKIGEKLPISDADLKAEWDNVPADKKKQGVTGQEIVLRVPKPDDEPQIQSKAADLVQQLRAKGTPVSEEAFADMAKGHSENPATALVGGKLRGPVAENPSKPDDPYQQLLKMQPGQVSDPIVYQGRVFILRRGEDVPKTFEQAKKELEVSLRNRKAYAAAAQLAQKVDDSLKQSKDPMKTATDFAGEANMSAAAMVKETGYVKPGDDIPDIGISSQFEDGIKDLAAAGDVGDKIPVKNGFAIPILVDKKDPRDADLSEVRDQVISAVKLEKAQAQVEEIAKQIAAAASGAPALAAAASSKGMTAKDQKDYVLGSPLGEGANAASSPALSDAIYALRPGEVTKQPLKVGDNWLIVGVTNRQDPNPADFAKQRSSLFEQMLSTRRASVFNDFITAARQRYQADGQITINNSVLDMIDAPTSEDLNDQPGS